jgi:glycosyltransferase involved in cell wall biosynthesis
MEMMQTFRELGHTVVAAAQESELQWSSRFAAYGIEYRQIYVERNGINPLNDFRTLKEIKILLKTEQPDRIFIYQAKTIIYGAMAASASNITEVYALVAGLGSVFRGNGYRNKMLGKLVEFQYKVAFARCKTIIFQNNDDRDKLLSRRLFPLDKSTKINGSGVNLEKFRPVPLPEVPGFLFIGRLIRDKGVIEYLQACKILKAKYPRIYCMLVGPYDTNPSALKPNELAQYVSDGVIEYAGEQVDVRPYIAKCSVFVLPSYHEGTPKTVLEAMAMGRAIVTSDAPGCRETVRDGQNGYLVQVKNVQMLVEKMEYLMLHADVSRAMGEESLKIVKERFDVKKVNEDIVRIMGV